MSGPIYKRTSGNNLLYQQIFVRVHQGGVKPKKVEFQKNWNNMLWVSKCVSQEIMQNKSAYSNHPAHRKRQKCGPILMFWANVKISQYFCTYWTFPLGWVIGLSWFLLHWVRLLETQVYTTCAAWPNMGQQGLTGSNRVQKVQHGTTGVNRG